MERAGAARYGLWMGGRAPPAPGPACGRAPRPASPPGVLSAVSWLGSLGDVARQRWLNGVTGSSLGEKVQRFLKGARGSSWMGFLGDLVVKETHGTWVQCLGQKDSPEKGMEGRRLLACGRRQE